MISALRLRPRGVALLVFLLYLLALPALTQRDIIASELSLSLLGLIFGTIIITATWGRRLRRTVAIKCVLSHPYGVLRAYSSQALTSKTRHNLILSLTPFSLPPLYSLTLRVFFSDGTTLCERQRFIGSALAERTASCSIVFPHRGLWRIEGIEVELGDVLGLTVSQWRSPASPAQEFRIVPPSIQVPMLPIMSSSHRAGESQIDTSERTGEPFDLKRYHPSDGLGKIAWKIFARRGELLSRHPEPSMTPEGKVFLYVLASRSDDRVAGTAIAYTRKLWEAEITPFTACERMETAAVAKTPEEAEQLLVESVWNQKQDLPASDAANLAKLISVGAAGNGRGVKVLIFLSRGEASRREGHERLSSLGSLLVARGAQPVFVICEQDSVISGPPAKQLHPGALWGLFVEVPALQKATSAEADYERFIGACAQRRWTILRAAGSARTVNNSFSRERKQTLDESISEPNLRGGAQ